MIKHPISSLNDLIETLERREQPLDIMILAKICSQWHLTGHLAVLTKPYLDKIIRGKKTIESRFSKHRTLPFDRIQVGDILFLKETSGPIHAIALASQVQFFGPLKIGEAKQIMEDYREELQLEADFKRAKQDSLYATLISLEQVASIKQVHVTKSDRRAWVILEAKK